MCRLKIFAILLFTLKSTLFSQVDSVLNQKIYQNSLFIKPYASPDKNSKKFVYWLTSKNFISIQDSNVQIKINPILNVSKFKSMDGVDSIMSYRNTRGFALKGHLGKKISFQSLFIENQGFFPAYQREFINNTGVYPGQGRVKAFKVGGFDFAQAQGVISIQPLKQWTIHLGNGKNFIGNGYRSLILSDIAFSYPYISNRIRISKKIHYTFIQSWLQDLNRLPAKNTSEAGFKRKNNNSYLLEYQPIKYLNISLFHSVIHNVYDSLKGNQPADFLFYQPLPLPSILKKPNQKNDIQGINASLSYSFFNVYGQWVNNLRNAQGFQLGVAVALKNSWMKLNIRLEQNKASSLLYAGATNSLNFLHYQQPLMHPMSGVFTENIIRLESIYFKRFGINIHWAETTSDIQTNKLRYMQGDLFVIINTAYNLILQTSYTNRTDQAMNQKDVFYTFGLKTNLYREYFDF